MRRITNSFVYGILAAMILSGTAYGIEERTCIAWMDYPTVEDKGNVNYISVFSYDWMSSNQHRLFSLEKGEKGFLVRNYKESTGIYCAVQSSLQGEETYSLIG